MSNYNPEAINRWRKKNRERSRYLSYRSTARTFVRHYATPEDVEELKEIYLTENPIIQRKKKGDE